MNAYISCLARCVIAASGLLSGCAEDTPADLIQSARNYIAKNEGGAAIIQLKTALQKKPDSPEARLLLGRALLDSGDAVSAEVELRKALALKQSDSSVLPALARALNQLDQSQKLIQSYAAVALDQPAAAADLKTSIAIAYAKQGKRKERDAALDSALASVPDYGPARRFQARLKADERDFDGALQMLDRILTKAPDDYEAWQLKGDLLFYVKGDAAAAQDAHSRALAVRKDFLPAHSSKILILLTQKDLPAAKARIDELKKIAPNRLQTKYLEGEFAFLTQDYKTARELAQQILKVVPDDLKALRLAGAVEYQIGSPLQAATFLNKALKAADHAPTRKLLAQTHLRTGDMVKVLETLAPLLDATDPDAETLSLAAQAHLQTGDIEKAQAFFGRAAASNPGDIRSRTALALTEFLKGNVDLGYSQLQQLASSDNGTFADMALISAYFRQGKLDAAMTAIDALEKKQPGKPIAADLRGRVQLARKDFAGARQSFEKALKADPLYFPVVAKLAGLDLADKKPEQARQRFEALLKVDPGNVQVLLALAQLKGETGGSTEEVAGLLREAVRLNPTVASPRLLLIDHYVNAKNMKAALVAAQEGVAARPDNAELLDTLGRVQVAVGDSNQALSSFNRLAELRPKSPLPLLRLADVYLSMKNTDAARRSLKQALAVSPNLLAAQRGLVVLEMNAGRPKDALAVAKSVQGAPGQEAVGPMLVGDVEAAQKEWVGAAAAYRTSLKLAPGSELAMKLHAVLISGAKATEADKFATGWAEDHPQDAAFRQYLGDRALSQVNYPLAESHYLAVVRLQPENAVAFNNLAWLAAQLKKPAALGYAEKANALKPEQPAFMDTLAMILANSNQVGKAIEIEKRAVALQPQYPTFRLSLARLYIQSGDKLRAKVELDQLAKLGDKFPGQAEVSKLLETL